MVAAIMTAINFSDGIYEAHRWNNGQPGAYRRLMTERGVRTLNILIASQASDALARAIECGNDGLRVRIRHMLHQPPGGANKTDDGMWQLPPDEWINNVAIAHGYHQMPVFLNTDNEFSTDVEGVLRKYISNETRRIERASEIGLKLAVMSFPSHWPALNGPTSQWLKNGLFDDYFRTIARYQGSADNQRILVCPNCYVNEHPAYGQDGVKNILALHQRFVEVTGIRPHMALGEYAFAQMLPGTTKIDAHGGWLTGLNRQQMISITAGIHNQYFAPVGIEAMLYTVAGTLGGNEVQTFKFSTADLDELLSSLNPPAPPPTDPTPQPPHTDPTPLPQPPTNDDHSEIVALRVKLEALEQRLSAIERWRAYREER
jgi:hypothetical protein